jgi:hypothetical protein
MENFCASKDIIKKTKRQTTEWEKIFANHIPDNGPVFIIAQQKGNPIFFKKRSKRVEKTFF